MEKIVIFNYLSLRVTPAKITLRMSSTYLPLEKRFSNTFVIFADVASHVCASV
jgi:hypothetical protein